MGNLELFPVLDWGTYRTFSQYWTGEPIEPFHRTGLGNLQNLFPVLDLGTYRTFSQYCVDWVI